MKNIEKYEEEIKKEIANFRNIPCIVKDLKDGGCGESRNCVTCSMEMLHWLSQECKEPILTDKEKAYLKNVIEPKKDDITWIRKWCFYKGTESEYTTVTVYAKHPAFTSPNSLWVLLDSIVTEEMPFKGMELEKAYSLEELGL